MCSPGSVPGDFVSSLCRLERQREIPQTLEGEMASPEQIASPLTV